jgi:hypothetical protein
MQTPSLPCHRIDSTLAPYLDSLPWHPLRGSIFLLVLFSFGSFLHGIHIWDFTVVYPQQRAVIVHYVHVILQVPLSPKEKALCVGC